MCWTHNRPRITIEHMALTDEQIGLATLEAVQDRVLLAGPPELGPVVMRASKTRENGFKEFVDVTTQAHAGAGRPQA